MKIQEVLIFISLIILSCLVCLILVLKIVNWGNLVSQEILACDIKKPALNASLIFNPEIDDFSLQPSTKGIRVKDQQLIIDKPDVENNEVELAREQAQRILANQPYQLVFKNETWTLDKETLIDWIKFEPNNRILGLFLDNDKVENYLAEIALNIDRPATNAQLETEGKRAIIFSPGQDGFEVKKQATIDQLTENLLADPPIKKTSIIADKASPKIFLWQTNKLGIKSLIGQGFSNFAGSPKNRIHNIKTGADKLNSLILNPGEEFSFNTLLGNSGPEQGFLPELVIKKNKTVLEYGGGLCQVSTTAFRAAVNSGLEITERSPHAFPVQYYNPQGFDATVYEPRPDLRFINNTPNHLLIETIVQGTQLFFNFYGTHDGRQVKIKGPYVLEKKEDGSMKTVLTQETYQKGELIDQQTFYSNYDSPDLYPVEGSEE